MRVYVRFKDGRSHTITRVVNVVLDETDDLLAVTNTRAGGTEIHVWSCPLSEVRMVQPRGFPDADPATRAERDVV